MRVKERDGLGSTSNRRMVMCEAQVAKRCRGMHNEATEREKGICTPCWQSINSKMLNRRRGLIPSSLKKKLMSLPIDEWDEYLPKH